jgi:transposase
VAELPPLAVEISEHRLQRLCCPDCGRTVRAELPAGVPRGCFGPKLEAAIASLTVRNRLSRRQLVELLDELFGCPIAVGTIDAILTRTAETLEPVYDELLEQTRAAAALNIDETGWYLSGEPRTLWGAFSKRTAVLRIAPDRSKQHLHGLIGEGFSGVVASDRFTAYNSLEPERRQVCWSHLRRDFTFHADLGSGPQEAFGLDGLEVTWNVFHAWKQFQQDGDRAALQQRVAAIKRQMWPLLEWGSTGKRQRHVRALAKNLLKLWPALWTFADVDDVEPTNNAAERGLRAAVIYRKLSLGSRSQGGERTIERLLSVDQTCRLQRRSLYAYLADALTAKARGDPVPSLMGA